MIDKANIEHLLKERETRFWGEDYKVTPAFVEKVFGDGNQLLGFTTMNSRPDYYLIRIDSSWDIDAGDIHDHIDNILNAIEDQYGRARYDDEDEEEVDGFPALDADDGYSWFDMTPQEQPK